MQSEAWNIESEFSCWDAGLKCQKVKTSVFSSQFFDAHDPEQCLNTALEA